MELGLRPELSFAGVAADELPANVETTHNPDVGSDSSLSLAHKWLLECHSNHDQCAMAADGFTPTRLLYIKSGGSLPIACLVENLPSRSVKWAALSYVWGGDQVVKATSSSLSAMKKDISVESLPQTLKDALLVCIKLGLNYLWVDCLCIVQDDAHDLKRELANMPKIYQRAWVTISASTAYRVSEGFLHKRAYRDSHPTNVISLPYLSKDGVNFGGVTVGEGSRINVLLDGRLPIHSRAWYTVSM
jgi:hypothetical protein